MVEILVGANSPLVISTTPVSQLDVLRMVIDKLHTHHLKIPSLTLIALKNFKLLKQEPDVIAVDDLAIGGKNVRTETNVLSGRV